MCFESLNMDLSQRRNEITDIKPLILFILFCIQLFSSCQKERPARRESGVPPVDTTTLPVDTTTLPPADTDSFSTFQKTYDGSLYDLGGSVLQTSEGGYAIAGSSNGDFYLIKTNQN